MALVCRSLSRSSSALACPWASARDDPMAPWAWKVGLADPMPGNAWYCGEKAICCPWAIS